MVENNLGDFTLGYKIANRVSFIQDAVDEIIEKDRENGNTYLFNLLDGKENTTLLLEYTRPDAVLSLILTALNENSGLELLVTSDKIDDASYFGSRDVGNVIEGFEIIKELAFTL